MSKKMGTNTVNISKVKLRMFQCSEEKIGNEKATVISTSVSMPKTTTVICVVNCGHDLEI